MGKSKDSKKSKSDKKESTEKVEIEYKPSIIAVPLAEESLTKKLFKVCKKASKAKHTRRGIKETVKAIRQGKKGLVVLAGNVSPVDVLTHLPVLCEENNLPYVFVNSKEQLGVSANTKRATSCLFITPGGLKGNEDSSEYNETYEECVKSVKKLH